MDGNGRWANARGLPRTEGHAAGETALLDVVNGALEIGIKWITLYAFSTENWRRPPDEVRYLMNFNQSLLMRRRDELNEKGVQIRFAGRRDWRVPRRVLKRMDESIELTKHNTRMVMTMAFNYGGRAEIVDAVRALVAEGTSANKIDEKAIRRHLYFPDMPDPDLVIRTSGETRISNFLLWEIAYSELVFPEILWPDMRRRHLYEAVIGVPAAGAPLRRGQPLTRDGGPAGTPDDRARDLVAAVQLREWGNHDRHPDRPDRGDRDPRSVRPRGRLRGARRAGRGGPRGRGRADRRRQPALRPPLARGRPPRPGSGRPRRRTTVPPTGPPRPAAPWPRPPAGASATAPSTRRPSGRASTREPLPRPRRRPAQLPPGRGRPHRRLPDRAPRQGARRRQGRAQDHLEVRRPAWSR